jgi:hypothetical protein
MRLRIPAPSPRSAGYLHYFHRGIAVERCVSEGEPPPRKAATQTHVTARPLHSLLLDAARLPGRAAVTKSYIQGRKAGFCARSRALE